MCPDQETIDGRTYEMVREFAHLGSADLVTRAGAGGQFHRRLQEAWRDAWADVGDPPELPVGLREAAHRADEAEARLADTQRKLKRQRKRRKLAEVRAIELERSNVRLAEAAGVGRIEGNPSRPPGGSFAYPDTGGGLLDRMNIDRDDLARATR